MASIMLLVSSTVQPLNPKERLSFEVQALAPATPIITDKTLTEANIANRAKTSQQRLEGLPLPLADLAFRKI